VNEMKDKSMNEIVFEKMNVTDVVKASPTKISLNRTIQTIKHQILFGLAFAAVALSIAAAEIESPPAGKSAAPRTLTGRIVFVDKTLHSVAIEVKGEILQINMVSHVKIVKGDKPASFDVLAVGQTVTLTFLETPDGKLDVASLSVDPSESPAEAAGRGEQQGREQQQGPPLTPPGPPVSRPPVSPFR
jgi:hypothetical protein